MIEDPTGSPEQGEKDVFVDIETGKIIRDGLTSAGCIRGSYWKG